MEIAECIRKELQDYKAGDRIGINSIKPFGNGYSYSEGYLIEFDRKNDYVRISSHSLADKSSREKASIRLFRLDEIVEVFPLSEEAK